MNLKKEMKKLLDEDMDKLFDKFILECFQDKIAELKLSYNKELTNESRITPISKKSW